MRLWTLHPKYLDKAGLTACWRESLLAQNVLMGKTKGYKNHSQLDRFYKVNYSIRLIGAYLTTIWEESRIRKYKFQANKIQYFYCFNLETINVNNGQLDYEVRHLQKKLLSRDFKKCCELSRDKLNNKIEVNPIFKIVSGGKENWEK